MFTGPSVRETDARLESSCGRLVPLESGSVFIASMESMLICGACTATRYCTPRLSSQYVGATTELEASETRRSFAMSRSVSRSEEHTSELQSPCNLVCRL